MAGSVSRDKENIHSVLQIVRNDLLLILIENLN